MTTMQDIKQAISELPDDEWHSGELFDFIKSERSRRAKRKAKSFSKGDKVTYQRDGVTYEGEVFKVFQTNVGVRFDRDIRTGDNSNSWGYSYKVPASELTLVEEGES